MSILHDASHPSLPYDLYARRACAITEEYIHLKDGDHEEVIVPPPSRVVLTRTADPIGILGAGPAGLYTALILDSPNIPYKVLEAQDRVGGRLFTYKFPDETGAPYNYFDVGAMRFPKIESMRRVFHLFEYGPLNTGGIALNDKVKPFYFGGAGNNNTLLSYNGVTVKQNAVSSYEVFNAKDMMPGVPDRDLYIKAGPRIIFEDVIDLFVEPLLKDLKTGGNDGWKYLMKHDMYSARAYMSTKYEPSDEFVKKFSVPKRPLPTDVVNWLETFSDSSGGFDFSLADTVLEAIAFGHVPKSMKPHPTQWFCIDGGSSQIAECMKKYIISRQPDAITYNSYVTEISIGKDGGFMDVVTNDTDHHRFSHVISTIPLPVLRTLDLSGSKLDHVQYNALRQLDYGAAVKIGLQFRTAWWTTGKDKNGKPLNIVGGQSKTDRIVRTIVYPSFGNIQAGEATTLIASYCWTEDSTRLTALIVEDNARLIQIVLRDLAEIHNVTMDFLKKELIGSKAWSWSLDPCAMGASAFFGPGKFENLYRSLNRPAGDRRLHFAGEALSPRHAWVEGALDTAWRAVNEMLLVSYFNRRDDFYRKWGVNQEWIRRPTASGGHHAPASGGHGQEGERDTIIPDLKDDLMFQQMKYLYPNDF